MKSWVRKTRRAVKKKKAAAVAAIITKKRQNSHVATLKTSQKIAWKRIRYAVQHSTGTHHSEVRVKQRQREKNRVRDAEREREETGEDTPPTRLDTYVFLERSKGGSTKFSLSLSRRDEEEEQEQLDERNPVLSL